MELLKIRDEVARLAHKFLRQTANDIPQWADEIELENRVTVALKQSKMEAGIAAVAEELQGKFNGRLQEHLMQWQATVVPELVSEPDDGARRGIQRPARQVRDRS